ncbi:uncharacterized protein LOC105700950 [Orussus abietinus]|uniref:uncharacterized protein LOC105700950 n=1 Tax=Orussus abietinus TaxID=222816 RepID=UPI0006262787|nr:uncharacterized protein LOC105700950 [Orussus abietinus]
MTCEQLHLAPAPVPTESFKFPWKGQKGPKSRRGCRVTCGMLPTLRVLASRECLGQGSVCLVPLDVELDSASHLQLTLLEAYCREIGVEVTRVTEDSLRSALGPGQADLSCVLVTNDDDYFLESPE